MNDQFSVLCFRFKSGEEILAELVGETSTHYTIAKACQVQIRPGADAIGKQTINIGLVPWLPFAKNPKELPPLAKADILFPYEPNDELKNLFQKMHGKIIAPATPQIIPGLIRG